MALSDKENVTPPDAVVFSGAHLLGLHLIESSMSPNRNLKEANFKNHLLSCLRNPDHRCSIARTRAFKVHIIDALIRYPSRECLHLCVNITSDTVHF